MSQNVWCRFFNCHKYEMIKEEELKNSYNIVVGHVMVSRCTNCGKIHRKEIYTEINYAR